MTARFAQWGIRFRILSSVAGYQVTTLLLPAVPELTGLNRTVLAHLHTWPYQYITINIFYIYYKVGYNSAFWVMWEILDRSAVFNNKNQAIYMAEEDLRHVGTCPCYTRPWKATTQL